MTSKSISQTYPNKDTVTCLPNTQLRSAIKRIELCELIEKELAITKKNNEILLYRLNDKDSLIKDFEKRDSLNEKRYSNTLIQVGNLNQQIDGNKIITGFYKNLNKKDRKIYACGGFIVGIATTLLILILK
jgi:hypothetical protein